MDALLNLSSLPTLSAFNLAIGLQTKYLRSILKSFILSQIYMPIIGIVDLCKP